jgi:hypothetical protein
MVGLMKDFLLRLKMVSRQISYMTPRTLIEKIVLRLFNFIWYTLRGNTRLER